MPTAWNTLYLRQNAIIDPTEGNTVAENAGALVGRTFGGANDKLFDEHVLVSTTNVGGAPGQLEQDNSVAGDTVTFDLGSGAVTTTFDAVVQYNATITYTDGSTWTGEVRIIEDALGSTFLVPNTSNNSAQQALVANPIQSLTLNSVIISNNSGLQANRQNANFVTCFAAQTRILTLTGEIAIEDMKTGDLVVTLGRGPQPLRWIGRTLTLGRGSHAPVCFAPGTFGNARPLLVSPQHRMLIRDWRAELLFAETEILVAAKNLVGMAGVTLAPCAQATDLHLMFDHHEIVMAEGVWTESFFPGDMAAKGDPEARAEILALFPDLDRSPSSFGPTARRVLRSPEATLLRAEIADFAMAALSGRRFARTVHVDFP